VESTKIGYNLTLDAIGLYVERERGFSLLYVVDAVQSHIVLDDDDVRALCLEASKRGWTRRGRLRSRLHSIGQYLDERQAASVVLQERVASYSIEFTGFEEDEYNVPELVRIHEQVPHALVEKLSTKKSPALRV